MRRAANRMEGASQRLDAGNLKGGAEDQEEALEELKRAQEQMAEDAEKKEEEAREEMARKLVARLQAMLTEQELISSETKDLDSPPEKVAEEPTAAAKPAEAPEASKKPPLSAEQRADGARGLARRERALETDAGDTLRILEADETSVMVPPVLKQVQHDLENVGSLLDRTETGEVAQLLQKDIETALRELIEALKPPDKDGDPPPPGSSQGRPMKMKPKDLVTPAMEVKMLHRAQRRIRERTERLEALGLVKEKDSPAPSEPTAEKPDEASIAKSGPAVEPDPNPLEDQARQAGEAQEALAGLTEALIKKYPLIDVLLLGGGPDEAEEADEKSERDTKEGEKDQQVPGPEGVKGKKKEPKKEGQF